MQIGATTNAPWKGSFILTDTCLIYGAKSTPWLCNRSLGYITCSHQMSFCLYFFFSSSSKTCPCLLNPRLVKNHLDDTDRHGINCQEARYLISPEYKISYFGAAWAKCQVFPHCVSSIRPGLPEASSADVSEWSSPHTKSPLPLLHEAREGRGGRPGVLC